MKKTLAIDDRVYTTHRGWGRVPDGVIKSRIAGLATDSHDRLFLFQQVPSHPIVILNPDGAYAGTWGQGALLEAHGICITPSDEVYLVDRDAHTVLKCTIDGKIVMKLGGTPAKYGQPFNHPTDLAVGPDGDLFISDGYGNHAVHRFSADGKHLQTWGSAGTDPGQLNLPHGIGVDPDGLVYVADRENNRIQVFTSRGEVTAVWTGFHEPCDIHLDRRGRVYVSGLDTRVHVLDGNGRQIAGGRANLAGHALCGDSTGALYVANIEAGLEKWIPEAAA